MAAIHELLKQVQDPALRARLTEEFARATQNKKFGLVFEEHMPECTPLYGIGIKRGGTVAKKASKINDTYTVIKLNGDTAVCRNRTSGETEGIAVSDLVAVAEFGEPIFPCLEHIDSVENAPDSDLWHTLIEADNYHALQLLEYLYPQKVDCIYIDPPYNTGAKDWKYNNDYVDGADTYRHSKWLSMMKKRLKLAKRLLNPENSVLIVTIDEKEFLHLGALLEELFPDNDGDPNNNYYGRCKMQMVSYVISQKTSVRKQMFSRNNEFFFYIELGRASVLPLPLPDEWRPNADDKRALQLRWADLLRCGDNGTRRRSPSCFYPILVSEDGKHFLGADKALPIDMDRSEYKAPNGTIPIWPIHKDGSEGCWGYSSENLIEIQKKGYVKLGKLRDDKMRITYLSSGVQKRVEEGKYEIIGYNEDGSIISDSEYRSLTASTQWNIVSHDATQNGTNLISDLIGGKFAYPKSLYSVHDVLRFFIDNNPNALVIDFFAGSGTTLHAVNLLNAEDGGHRRCILVTNNEVSEAESIALSNKGYQPGDDAWEKLGIARLITWPRTINSILGCNNQGEALSGEYITVNEIEKEETRHFNHISFIKEPNNMKPAEKKQLLALFAKGILPQNLVKADTKYIVSDNEKHTISVLFDDTAVDEWLEALDGMDHITDFYIVTEKKATFNAIKDRVTDVLGNIIVQEQVKRPMKDGFAANCEYFKLGFLDRDMVSLGQQFREILPLLWMKSGAVGKRPEYTEEDEPLMLILPENHFAVLVEEDAYSTFAKEVRKYDTIDTIYFVTNSESAYHEMSEDIGCRDTYQLYRDYIDNFVIGARRDRI